MSSHYWPSLGASGTSGKVWHAFHMHVTLIKVSRRRSRSWKDIFDQEEDEEKRRSRMSIDGDVQPRPYHVCLFACPTNSNQLISVSSQVRSCWSFYFPKSPRQSPRQSPTGSDQPKWSLARQFPLATQCTPPAPALSFLVRR